MVIICTNFVLKLEMGSKLNLFFKAMKFTCPGLAPDQSYEKNFEND